MAANYATCLASASYKEDSQVRNVCDCVKFGLTFWTVPAKVQSFTEIVAGPSHSLGSPPNLGTNKKVGNFQTLRGIYIIG
jgi:hypothetical protein